MNRTSWLGSIPLALALATQSAPVAAKDGTDRQEALALMPNKLGGASAMKFPDGTLMYLMAGPGGDKIIVGVTVTEKALSSVPAELLSLVRKMAGQTTETRQTAREGTFTTPKWAGAATFFGDYVTGENVEQYWLAMTGKVAITVTISCEKKDARRAEALVADKIFGGAVISAAKPAE